MYTVASVIRSLIEFYELLLVIWCVLSWFPTREGGFVSDLRDVLDRIVGPYMSIFQRFIPPVGGIDFSPILALIVLQLVGDAIVGILS